MTKLEEAAAKFHAAAAEMERCQAEVSDLENRLHQAKGQHHHSRFLCSTAEQNLCRVARGEEPVE